jgi:murein DD-endopeptidase MepM/ murein hydrolase activator NlpD
MKDIIKVTLLLSICTALMVYAAYGYGQIKVQEEYESKIDNIEQNHSIELSLLNNEIESKNMLISHRDHMIEDLLGQKENLSSELQTLNSRVAGISTSKHPFPFAVPSAGFLGHNAGTYGGTMLGMPHLGVDIWTTLSSGGAISTRQGNPVYSACDGVVNNFQLDNGGVTILCDKIPDYYNVPKHEGVSTYYGHMGNGGTGELYIYIKYGQRVRRGQFIGYQGDMSSFTPAMRNVHLHFSIFTGHREVGGALDPCLYIGGSCTQEGRFFNHEIE